jgi:hypothetical protein
MTRLALTLAAACLAALLLPSAAAALIQVDRGIAGVRPDNTRAALGRPALRRRATTSSAASSSGGSAAASACCSRADGA